MRSLVSPLGLLPGLLLVCAAAPRAQRAVSFDRDVRPLLADRCFHCHGPDGGQRKAGLRLDRPDGAEGAYRERDGVAAIRPGSIEASALWRRVNADDPGDVMPPPESHKPRLTAAERRILARWIEDGARYERHWAFVAPTAPALPEVADPAWPRQPLDRFVLRRLEGLGLRPGSTADPRTLIRRVTLDLTGLPPTREEVTAFVADPSPEAYARHVDRLLARPHYGEHMARYWLDLVRFADTNGVHHDHYREMSPYRDWVIRAFNRNLPYDAFVTDQVAGDLGGGSVDGCGEGEPTDDQLIASGFNRLHMIIDVGTALPEESHVRNVIDRVTAFGTAFLGLTVQCAVCHDHKYDPIAQADFYRLTAFFNNLDAKPETGRRGTSDFRRGLQPPYVSFPSEAQLAELAELERELEAASRALEERKAALADVGDDEAAKEPLQAARKEAEAAVTDARKRHDAVLREVPAAMVMRERAEVRPAHVLIRGDYQRPGAEVERGTPAFLPPLQASGARASRLDLARWLVSGEHPLTARVAVNRFWQQLFGTGLVKTAEDFGTQGERPSHPDLLDHLATSFVASGWDVKRLMRRLVLSATYRQASAATPDAFARDPGNRLLARGARFRLDAEVIRDQILATSGVLAPTLYGRSVKPPQPDGVWKAVTLPSSFPRRYQADEGEATRRRSVYTFWKRGMPPPQMSIFDAPTREACVARRERTNTPLQALLLLNEQEYLRAARHLALRALRLAADSAAARLAWVYETITARLPDEREAEVLLGALRELQVRYAQEPELAAALVEEVELPEGVTAADLAAWTMVASAVYNLDITKARG